MQLANADHRFLSIERGLPFRVEFRTPAAPETRRSSILDGATAAYAAVVVVASTVAIRAMTPTLRFASVQAANQAISGLVLMILVTAAGLGLSRIPAVRYACPLMGVWLMLSPLLVPGAYSGWVILGGVAALGASGWAADAVACRPQPKREP